MFKLQVHGEVPRKLIAALPWFVLLTGLLLTWAAWRHERQVAQAALRSQFDFALRESVNRIEQRVQGYEQMLRGVQSLFATTSLRNRAALRDYVDALQLDANFAGIQAIGLVEWVPRQHLKTHLASMRRAGYPDYAIQPAGDRQAYAPIIQREPYIGLNRAPVGVDLLTSPVRKLTLEKARDSGMPAISGKVQLLINKANPKAPPGFLMYLPVFANGREHSSIATRRENLIGWVYASFHMDEFMASLYGRQVPGLELAIHDSIDMDASSLLYQYAANDANSPPPALSAIEYLVVAGHNWTLSLKSQKAFVDRYGRGFATLSAIAGITLSLLLTLLVWVIIHGRAQALRLAESMTEQLRHAAQHDALTGLPNRAMFADRLSQEIARAHRRSMHFALLFMDLDNFKPINDTFGHGVGDQVLQRIAQRLLACVRAEDTVGRVGGDEFVLLLSGLSTAESILHLAEKIRAAVRMPLTIDGNEFTITCSIGVALFPQAGTDAISLTQSADQAMYKAKSDGRNCVRLTLRKGEEATAAV